MKLSMLNIKIVNGTVVDGTGTKAYSADIGIADDRIAAIGDLKHVASKITLDAAGKIVVPGFIDMHTHSDVSMLLDDTADSMLRNGVTTNLCGNCGEGIVPISAEYKDVMVQYMRSGVIPGNYPNGYEYPWSTFQEYHAYIRRNPPLINMASLVAHGPIRMSVMGMGKGAADERQIDHMRALVREGMEAGAFGLSTGLAYSPGDLVDQREILEIAKPVRDFGGIYATHMRNQGEGTFASLEETKYIGEGAGIPIHVSHLKLADPRIWGKTEDVFRWFEQMNAAGLRATFDVYPYTRGCSGILRLLPPWAKEGGVADTIHRLTDPEIRKSVLHDCRNGIDGWENLAENIGWQNVFVTSFRKAENMGFEGLTVAQISDRLGRDPWEVYLDLVVEEEAKAGILVASMSTADMEKIVCHPESILASDGAAQSLRPNRNYGFQHPRAYGTQTKVLRRFVREKKLLTMEEAVKKMTSMPAELLGMKYRGKIKQGFYADVVVFDPETVSDMSTFSDLQRAPEGIETVIVNGILALKEGKIICKTAGRLITKTDMA